VCVVGVVLRFSSTAIEAGVVVEQVPTTEVVGLNGCGSAV
jgi:hypothetical protein